MRFVADPYGEFTQGMAMSIDHRDASLGVRSWRYSMLVDDGKIEKMFIEPDKPGDPFEVSDAEQLRPGSEVEPQSSNVGLTIDRYLASRNYDQ